MVLHAAGGHRHEVSNEYVDVRQPLSDADGLDAIEENLPGPTSEHRSFSPAEITHGEL